METISQSASSFVKRNRVVIKGFTMGVLILLMLIPTVIVYRLVEERKSRQHQIVEEVSSKWAHPQTLTGPYLYVPYTTVTKNSEGKIQEVKNQFWILPDELNVNGTLNQHIRKRSIYNVLLYSAYFKNTGNFILHAPVDVDTNSIHWKDARICYGVSDFKGIEEKLVAVFKGNEYELSPGLPAGNVSEKGLSAAVDLSSYQTGTGIPFGMRIKIKGSENIRFMPLAGNSSFNIASSWPSPSFSGSILPDERNVTDSGFTAQWNFNKANLPFGTVLKDVNVNNFEIDFGVSLLQPTDQYAKTERCVKYAILFIGLTFGLFFIVEITRNKPVHPLQYLLIGLALVIFYTLLLSLSEFIHFDYAYLISAVAIITMITLFSKQLFQNIRSSLLTGGILTMLYSFIFVLIRLEDTALLVGSIGLFIVLAIVMYTSRKIDWYGTKNLATQ